VLAVRSDKEPKPFEHALVPTDFSASAEYAVDVAAQLVRPEGLVTLLHALELPIAYFPKVPDADFSRDLDKRTDIALEQAAAPIEDRVRVTTSSRIGSPGAQILAAIDEDPTIDVVVMGSHGRTGIKRVVMGSVAEKVVRYARCPVLVARKRG
jgi:nucleotide-binding universal stress UspA family protein